MLGTPYICALYVATAGQQGNALGSDEEEIVLLIYVVFDMTRNKIIGVQQYIVKPTTIEAEENVLSEQVTTETKLTEDLVRNLGIPLEVAIKQFDGYVRSLQIDPCSPLFRFVTDGQLPLRQCLHPEACSKNIDLPEYYNVFHDLRKDFRTFYNVPTDQELSSITHLVKHLRMTRDVDHQFYASEMKDMINIIQRLISDGHCFSTPETILIKLEPGICWKDEEVDNNCVVRARGLPWQSSDQDIAKFFRGLNVVKGGVALCLSAQGRRNGEALVRFVNQEHRDMALKRHKHHIGNRYIEVYKANGDDFVNVAGGSSNEAQAFLTKGAQVIIRMRGLPYDCTAKQVLEFFESGNEDQSCKVMDGEDGVLFVKKLDGRATGDAFVLFANEEDSPKALSKHRELIGTRYIELFRSTTAEVQQVLNRSMDPKTYEQPTLPLPPPTHLGSFQYLPQHIITSGTRKDCIRLRGLPYEAMVEHILEFLGEHAKNIAFQGVHMVYNAQGQPSGEAFIQMNSEQSAFAAAQMRHHHYMYFGKKQRYIEVFQCSGEDMNLVLTGGIPTATAATTASVSPIKTLISPGMLNTTTLLPANPNNTTFAGTTSAIPTTALLPPQSAAATAATAAAPIAWDPISALQMQQVLAQAQAQAQAIRTQESVWLINHLAAQQQMQQMHQIQLAALTAAAASKQFQWTAADLNGTSGASAGTTVLPALPPPPSVTPISSIVNTSTTVSTPSTAAAAPKSKVTSFSPTVYPGTTPIHIPQSSLSAAAAAAAATSSQPLLLINIPRITPVSQHQQAATNKIGCSSSSPTPAGTATISLSSSAAAVAADPLAQYNAASLLNFKRTWEQAFPAGMVSAQAPLKRQTMVPYSLPSLSTIPANSAIFTVPPPQLPSPSTAVQQQPTVGFRTAAQYYTGA